MRLPEAAGLPATQVLALACVAPGEKDASVPEPQHCYLVCTNARSGSTMLCQTLADVGTAGHPQEYFLTWPHPLPHEDGYWENGRLARQHGVTSRDEFLSLVYRLGSTPNGVFGAKMLWRYVPLVLAGFREMPRFAGMTDPEIFSAAFPGLKVIHLTRRDRLRQAVSWHRAVEDGVWWQDDSTTAPPGPQPEYQFEVIAGMVRLIAEGERSWRALYSTLGVTPFEVVYEDLLTDEGYHAAVQGILAHLELDDRVVIPRPRTRRQADDISEGWIERFFADVAAMTKPLP
jgi:trehalose 2-sulfotransferase